MAQPPSPDDDALAAWLVRRFPKTVAGARAAGCPDADLLAGFAEGTLPDEGRAALEDHLASCASCTAAAAEFASLGEARSPARGATKPTLRLFAIAAVVLVGVGLALVLGGDGDDAPRDADSVLVASARRLAKTRPDLFAGFEPVGHAERTAPAPTQVRGGLVPGFPAGVLLEPRPSFRWSPVAGVSTYDLSVIAADGSTLWSRRVPGSPSEYPGDAPALVAGASYAWEVAAEGPAGPVSGRRGFRVASADEAALVEAARKALETQAEPALLAHWLARREMWAEAERALLARGSKEAPDVELLRYVRARAGLPADAPPGGAPG